MLNKVKSGLDFIKIFILPSLIAVCVIYGLMTITHKDDIRTYNIEVVEVEYLAAGEKGAYDYTIVISRERKRYPFTGIHAIPNGNLSITVNFGYQPNKVEWGYR